MSPARCQRQLAWAPRPIAISSLKRAMASRAPPRLSFVAKAPKSYCSPQQWPLNTRRPSFIRDNSSRQTAMRVWYVGLGRVAGSASIKNGRGALVTVVYAFLLVRTGCATGTDDSSSPLSLQPTTTVERRVLRTFLSFSWCWVTFLRTTTAQTDVLHAT